MAESTDRYSYEYLKNAPNNERMDYQQAVVFLGLPGQPMNVKTLRNIISAGRGPRKHRDHLGVFFLKADLDAWKRQNRTETPAYSRGA